MTLIGKIVLATLAVSFISLAGVVLIQLKDAAMTWLLGCLVSFAVGGLLGGAFLHLFPEAAESGNTNLFTHALIGIIFFLFMERFLRWRHCHQGRCEAHSFTYINLVGDGIHNFIDGMIIAASFVQDPRLGLATTVAVAAHELPQELGDFAMLVYGGFGKKKALLLNLLSGLVAVFGALLAYYQMNHVTWLKDFLVPFTAGGFIYLALVDMVPELHRKSCRGKTFAQTAALLAGLGVMGGLKMLFDH
ncbi:hypothetical protein OR1_00565 [Geobacter sp. OR-1]|uniref:ZIP family metal transporter n=1 Tax=Geobacter sp. OR-1 TaxID=1266765 RepID=UPI000542CD2E|nr:ZIP family metal transporter [Geobacter sp. OR-1]GAM08294.1 hypothetical protein OR1_00565 [Geobacter sp. OR-1]